MNIAKTLWRKLKYELWQPSDYMTADRLFHQAEQALAAVGATSVSQLRAHIRTWRLKGGGRAPSLGGLPYADGRES